MTPEQEEFLDRVHALAMQARFQADVISVLVEQSQDTIAEIEALTDEVFVYRPTLDEVPKANEFCLCTRCRRDLA